MDDKSAEPTVTDVNRNVRPKSESDDLADVFEALTIDNAASTSNQESASAHSDISTSTPASASKPKKLDPDLKIKMAEFDLKLAQVPAVVTPEVQEEAKHLIRVLVLGQEGAKAYEEAMDDASETTDLLGPGPTMPLVAPTTPLDSLKSADLDGRSPVLIDKPVLTLEDSGILEPVAEDVEIKMEDA